MYRHLTTVMALLVSLCCWAQPIGWASVDGTTDGGRGENPVVVTTYKQLRKALAQGDTLRRTIYLQGRIVLPKPARVKEVSNKTIIGLAGSSLVNDRYTLDRDSTGILLFDGCRNIVLQNITFKGPGAFDRDANDNLCFSRSERIWVDHCDFQDGMDGNFDCNAGSDLITVSWCRFRYLKKPWPKLADDTNDDHNSDHRFSSLWGSNDRDGARCEGRLRTTFHHCWWDEGCVARMPFVRFGQVHLLNCLYSSSVATVYVQARYHSNVLVEGCAFTNRKAGNKLFQTPSASNAKYQDYNIRFSRCLGADDLEQRHGDAPYFTPPYDYSPDPAADVERMVKAGAGATLRLHYRTDVPLDSIRLSDPAILADKATGMYYMTGTGGMLWRSPDLQRWEGPLSVTQFERDSWMGPHPMIWAAELHQTGDGWYYYFATFTNQAVKIDTVRGNVIERRASQVLRSRHPMGPYRAFGDATYLPADRPTLDGTFWRDRDGRPYMVFCGEWLQNWNGTIEKIELKPDLSGTVGQPRVLFRASDSPWSRERDEQGRATWNKVTDGPWLFRTATGRLGMLWTSWVYDVYTQGVAYSESGTLDGPWLQEPDPVTPPGYGHSMLFQRFDGQWMMSVHHHSKDARGRTVRTPHLFEVDLSGDKLIVKQ